MQIDILTLFPEMFDLFCGHSIMKRALQKKIVAIKTCNLRDYTHDRHKTCDDKPFGGGPGMLMKPEPIFEAMDALVGKKLPKDSAFIYLSPQGKPFNQKKAKELSQKKRLFFLCGHYEGVDERVIENLVTDEISIGDYVLTGGELPAMVVMDSVIRLIPGVLGSEESKEFESFSHNLLEYPQYTRPASYRGFQVPAVLLSGNHKEIKVWQERLSKERTLKRRPDLLKKKKE